MCYHLEGRNRVYKPLSPSLKADVDSINKKFQEKIVSKEDVILLLKELIKSEYRKQGTQAKVLNESELSKVNDKIFNQFWQEVYAIRYISDEKSAQYDFKKSLRLIEPLSIQSASALELQTQLKTKSKTSKENRRATDRLNQILFWLKRNIKLNKPKVGLTKVDYLTFDEFQKVLIHLEGDIKILAMVLFASGMRLSESFAVTPEDFVNGHIMVNKQLTEEGITKLPKREKTGKSVVIPDGREAMEQWVLVENKSRYRYAIYNQLIEACRKVFPNQRDKWVSPHDLRHSHAIYLLSKGASLTQVALNLRNRIDVCQRYYTGFAHSEDTLEALNRLI